MSDLLAVWACSRARQAMGTIGWLGHAAMQLFAVSLFDPKQMSRIWTSVHSRIHLKYRHKPEQTYVLLAALRW